MRIISGQARGRKLYGPPGHSQQIRPTSDRAREALFSIIGPRVMDGRVLDLYAGTGALGIESLSRGANMAVFVDKHLQALDLIQRNCDLCLPDLACKDAPQKAIIIKLDLERGLRLQGHMSVGEGWFDLIFLDPPYNKGLAMKSLLDIDTSELIGPNTLIIAEEQSAIEPPQSFTRLRLSDQRHYGDTGFWFYRVDPS